MTQFNLTLLLEKAKITILLSITLFWFRITKYLYNTSLNKDIIPISNYGNVPKPKSLC